MEENKKIKKFQKHQSLKLENWLEVIQKLRLIQETGKGEACNFYI